MRDKAVKIVERLNSLGFPSFFAGGYVRDMILGHESHDIDIATSATPDEIEKIFSKTIPVGKQFGIIIVVMDGEHFEVATFRNDGVYTDGRRPDSVSFSSPEEDAQRRDLTINGLFYDPIKNEIIDFVGGKKDITNRVIRFIGVPDERIEEDRLRMLRAVRFACKLGFDFDEETWYAIERNAHRITDVSQERIKSELDKMLLLKEPSRAITILHNSGLLKHILPEVNDLWGCVQSKVWHSEGDVFIHTMRVLDEARKLTDDLVVLWAALLHDIGKPLTTKIDEFGKITCHGHAEIGVDLIEPLSLRLKFTCFEKDMISSMVKDHMKITSCLEMKKATLRKFISQDHFSRLFILHEADCLGTTPSSIFGFSKMETVKFLKYYLDKHKDDLVLPKPFVTGKHLIDRGMKPGPLFKEILSDIMDKQLEGTFSSTEEALSFLDKEYF